MGEEKWRVFLTGAPGLDALSEIKYFPKETLAEKLSLNPDKKWFVLLHHPTPLDNIPIKNQIQPVLGAISRVEGEKIIIYPNSDSGSEIFIKEIEKYRFQKNFHIFKNLLRENYLNLIKVIDVLLGNSSSGILESTYFKIPTINIGNRQKDREHGLNVINVGYNEESIYSAIQKTLSPEFKNICRKSSHPYGRGGAGKKIVTIIEKHVRNSKLLYKEFKHA